MQNHTVFTYKTLSLWFLSATYHSLGTRSRNSRHTQPPHTHLTTSLHTPFPPAVLFFGAYLLWDDGVLDLYGRTLGFWDLGNMILIAGYLHRAPTNAATRC